MKQATEYLIRWVQPKGYDPSAVLRKLPSPVSRHMTEIYNFAVRPDGFYLIDRKVDVQVAGNAMKLFIDEALSHTDQVVITILKK